EGPVEVLWTSRLHNLKPHPERPRCGICLPQHLVFHAFTVVTRVPERSDPAGPRNDLLEQFHTLAHELRGEKRQPRDIAARPRQASDKPAPNRIGSPSEDDGDCLGRLLGGQGGGRACDYDDIYVERNKLGRETGEPVVLPDGIPVFDHHIAALDVTEVPQSLEKGLVVLGREDLASQVAYSRDLGRFLRLDG